jgi:hypothetical protein
MKKSIGSYLLLMTVAVTANAQSYLGQWHSEENDTYLLFDADSLVFAYGVEPDNCYEFETLAHADDGEFITLSDIEGSVSFPYVLEADTLMITEEEGQTAYVASNLDLSALMNCAEIYSWSCGSQGCYQTAVGEGEYLSEDDCTEFCLFTSITEQEGKRVVVYPNPFRDHTVLEFKEIPLEYNLYDVNGRIHRSERVMENRLQLNKGDLPSGIYHLEVIWTSTVSTVKLLIE